MLRTETQVATLLSETKARVLARCIDKAKAASHRGDAAAELAWREVAAMIPDIFAEAGSQAIRTKGM